MDPSSTAASSRLLTMIHAAPVTSSTARRPAGTGSTAEKLIHRSMALKAGGAELKGKDAMRGEGGRGNGGCRKGALLMGPVFAWVFVLRRGSAEFVTTLGDAVTAAVVHLARAPSAASQRVES